MPTLDLHAAKVKAMNSL